MKEMKEMKGDEDHGSLSSCSFVRYLVCSCASLSTPCLAGRDTPAFLPFAHVLPVFEQAQHGAMLAHLDSMLTVAEGVVAPAAANGHSEGQVRVAPSLRFRGYCTGL